ncbi:MAG: 50S ribosomal protein L32 [Candidatus Omnitrophica bacterium]|nr:50S ribosomal protein L32 [Candidatus Omnitrophota bacterium]
MPNPKRKHSKSRTAKRRSTKKIKNVSLSKCPNCGALKLPHFVCKVCGYYRGVQVIKIESKK